MFKRHLLFTRVESAEGIMIWMGCLCCGQAIAEWQWMKPEFCIIYK